MNKENQQMSAAAYVRWTGKLERAYLIERYGEDVFPKAPVVEATATKAPTFAEQVSQMRPDVMLMAGWQRR